MTYWLYLGLAATTGFLIGRLWSTRNWIRYLKHKSKQNPPEPITIEELGTIYVVTEDEMGELLGYVRGLPHEQPNEQ